MPNTLKEIKDGDTVHHCGATFTADGDAHYSGDASYDGYIVYDTNGNSYFSDEW